MARPTLMGHRKFRRLAREVESVPLARGLLECLWDSAYESGDEYLGDADDVEMAAGWTDAPGRLALALRDAGGPGKPGFIEEGGSPFWPEGAPGSFRVHDLWDHAPEYVRKRHARESARRGKSADRGPCPPNGGQSPPNGGRCPENGTPPSPSPSPAPYIRTEEREESFEPRGDSKQAEVEAEALRLDPPLPLPPKPDERPLIVLPCVGKGPKTYGVTRIELRALSANFPGLDVEAEVRKAAAWLDANPTRRKTHRGIRAFLVSWLSRATDRAGGPPGRPSPQPPQARPEAIDGPGGSGRGPVVAEALRADPAGWGPILSHLSARLSLGAWSNIRELTGRVDDGVLQLRAPDGYRAAFIRDNLLPVFETAAREVGVPLRGVEVRD